MIYRYNLVFHSVAETVIEFIVCKVIFIDYMHSFDDNLGNDDEHLIMFYGTYLMFCLPYKVFSIIVLHSYSQFKLDTPIAEGVDEDRDFVSKMQHVNRSYLDEAESESHGTAADFDLEIEPLIGRKSEDAIDGIKVL